MQSWQKRFLLAIMCIFGLIAPVRPAEKIRVLDSSGSALQAPFMIAREAKLLEKNNLDVEFVLVAGGSIIVPALLSGDADIASLAPAPAILAWQSKAADLVLVAGGVDKVIQALVTRPDVTKVSDLKGKKIGVSRIASLSDVSFREVLKKNKLTDKDVTFVQMGLSSDRILALQKGLLDATMLNHDQVLATSRMGLKTLVDLRDEDISIPSQGIVTTKKFLTSNRATVKRLLLSYVEGIRLLKSDKAFSMAALAKHLRISDPEILAGTYNIYSSVFSDPPFVNRKGVETVITLLARSSVPRDLSLIDNSVLEEVLEDRR
jgi:ABC-type nitrate/sulfonate/bicarbonate transport system substrate-binding protein